MAKDKTDITTLGRDHVAEVLAGSCVIIRGDGKTSFDVNEAELRYESAQKDVMVALQTKYGADAVKAFRGSKMSVGAIAKALEAQAQTKKAS